MVRDRSDDDPQMRIGFTVTKKIGNAVIRNLKSISELTAKMTVMTGYSSRDYVGETRIVSL